MWKGHEIAAIEAERRFLVFAKVVTMLEKMQNSRVVFLGHMSQYRTAHTSN